MTNYNAMTIVTLKSICKERGIPYANINKAGIIKALEEADATEKPEAAEEAEEVSSEEEGSENDGSEEDVDSDQDDEGEDDEGEDDGDGPEDDGSEGEEASSSEEEAPPPPKKAASKKKATTKPLKVPATPSKKTDSPKKASAGKSPKKVETPKKVGSGKKVETPKKTPSPKKASSPKKVQVSKKSSPEKPSKKKATEVAPPQQEEITRVSDVKGALEAVRAKLDLYAKRSDTEYRRLSQLLSSARPEAYRTVFENFLITDSVRTCMGSLSESTRKALEQLNNKVLEEVLGGFLNHSKITYLPEVGAFVDQGYAYVVGDKALVFGRVEGTSVLALSDKDLAKFAKDEVWHLVMDKPLPNAKMIATLIANTVAPLGTPEGSEEGSEEEDGQAESQVAAELESISRKRPGRKEWQAYVKAQRSLKGDASANYKAIAAEAKIPEASARYIAANYAQLQTKYAKKA